MLLELLQSISIEPEPEVKEIKSFLDNNKDKSLWYRTYYIPKRKGGKREINEPIEELKILQRNIMQLIEKKIKIHKRAFAYKKDNCCLDVAKIHKENAYVYFLDIKDFFNSIDIKILNNEVRPQLEEHFSNNLIDLIFEIALKDNGLPQGSPLSPILSNLVLKGFDEIMYNNNKYYTRYADDIIMSSKELIKLPLGKIQSLLPKGLKLNKEKTKIIKNTGRLYILGIKLNQDNNLTYGNEKKKKLKLDLYNLFINHMNNTTTKEEVQELLGQFSYMASIEPNYAKYLERKLLEKFKSEAKTIYKHFL